MLTKYINFKPLPYLYFKLLIANLFSGIHWNLGPITSLREHSLIMTLGLANYYRKDPVLAINGDFLIEIP